TFLMIRRPPLFRGFFRVGLVILFLCYIINDQTTPPINLGVWLFSRAKKGHNFETKGKGMNNKLS
ncbi:hypothetical protein, partial [Staphylococcus aureus]|uniref:hypothetical protein n=1 Tax=Staphylococcus aureus TaxID=1280 RepID=UPI003D11A1D8